MALNIKQTQTQKQMQKLSPQQVQLMMLMLVTTTDIEQRIEQEIQENPALEEENWSSGREDVSISRIQENDDRLTNDDDSASDAKLDNDSISDSPSELDKAFDRHPSEPSSDLPEGRGDENPASSEDRGDDFDYRDYVDPDKDDYAYKAKSDNYRDPDDDFQTPIRFNQGFQEKLTEELNMLPITELQKQIGQVIIGNLDSDGYLQRSVEAMVNDLAFGQNIMVDESQVEEVLKMIQQMEPVGIGSRDLRECLMIQLQHRIKEAGSRNVDLGEMYLMQNALHLLDICFDEFVKRQYSRMTDKLKISEEDLSEVVDYIKTLNPRPGAGFSDASAMEAMTIIPDFSLTNEDGELILQINSRNTPRLRVSSTYENMMEEYGRMSNRKTSSGQLSKGERFKAQETQDAALFVKQKIDSAQWFIEMIRQRKDTMLRTMQAIVDFQHNYFLEGEISKLKPMVLKDIAEIVGLDVSTVSRVLSNKYIQTHFGTFPVKNLFSQALENEDGEEVSTSRIKALLKQLIDDEDKRSPLTDEQLANLLREHNLLVARRTVAKYREGLGLPVARLRRRI